ncbi:MAG: copper amine oxidase N-terminal domain-containing protein [Bacillota bacterium]
MYINGQAQAFDVLPTVVAGRTLVPLRANFEDLGAEVTWDPDTQIAMATWPGGDLQLPVGSTEVTVRGEKRQLDVPGQIIGTGPWCRCGS